MTETELAGSAAAAGTRRRAGFRRLLANLGIANGALSALYAGVGTILLPQQIENLGSAAGRRGSSSRRPACSPRSPSSAPLLALLIINHLGGYPILFIAGGCCGIIGAVAVTGVRSVR